MRLGERTATRTGERARSRVTDLPLGVLIEDRPGVNLLSFEVPITGPIPYTATAALYYTPSGQSEIRAPDMVRVRADLGTEVGRTDAFAGAIWDLEPGASYGIRIEVVSEGVTSTLTTSIATRPLPAASGVPTNVITSGTSKAAVQNILDNASAGDVIEFRGTHNMSGLLVPYDRNGTASNPIYIRGDDRNSAIIGDNATSPVFTIAGDHVVLEELTLNGNTSWDGFAVRIDGRTVAGQRDPSYGVCVRGCIITGKRGISLYEDIVGEIYDAIIYDNILIGAWTWADIVALENSGDINQTWDHPAFKVTGEGHALFHNTIRGFGDGFKIDRKTLVDNIGISIIRNDIEWGGDDAVELDDGYRNCVAYQNRFSNTATGISKQPNNVTGGPNYAVRNVVANVFSRPIKLNDAPNGVVLIHNTFAVTELNSSNRFATYPQNNNGDPRNLHMLNNLWVNVGPASTQHITFASGLDVNVGQWDGSAYYPPNLSFQFAGVQANDLLAAQAQSAFPDGYAGAGFEFSGEEINDQPFVGGIGSFGLDWETRVSNFNPELTNATNAYTNAINLPGYNSSSRGAVEYGDSAPVYGARIGTSALQTAALGLAPGEYLEDFTAPTGDQVTTAGPGTPDTIMTFQGRMHYHRPTRTVHLFGAGHNTPAAYIKYDEATDNWITTGQNDPYGTTGHGYDHSTIDQATGDMWVRPVGAPRIERWNATTNSWDYTSPDITQSAANKTAIGIAYHPNLFGSGNDGIVFLGRFHIYGFRLSTQAWVQLASFVPETHASAVYIPSLDAVFCGGGNGSDQIVRVAAGGTVTNLGDVSPINFGTSSPPQGTLVPDPRGSGMLILESPDSPPAMGDVYESQDGINWSLHSSQHPFCLYSTEGYAPASIPEYGVLYNLTSRGSYSEPRSMIWKP